MTLSESRKLTLNFDSGGHISTFRAQNSLKSEFQEEKKCLQNFWTALKHLSNSPKNDFFGFKNGQNGHFRGPKYDPRLKFWGSSINIPS